MALTSGRLCSKGVSLNTSALRGRWLVQKRKAVIVQKITKGGRLDLRARVGGQKSQNTSDVHNGSPLSGHSHMKSSQGGGGWPKLNYSTDRLCECYSDKGEGVKNPENIADVMFAWP